MENKQKTYCRTNRKNTDARSTHTWPSTSLSWHRHSSSHFITSWKATNIIHNSNNNNKFIT